MNFTQDDFNLIEQELKRRSIKDSQFDNASLPLNGDEYIAIVQNSNNYKLNVSELADTLNNSSMPDFTNITEQYNLQPSNLADAVNALATSVRRLGKVVTFLDETNNWQIYQFIGNALSLWSNTTYWEPIVVKTYVDGQISSIRTDFEVIEGQISSKVTQASQYAQTATDASTSATTSLNSITTIQSSITQTASHITSQVEEVDSKTTIVQTAATSASASASNAATSATNASSNLGAIQTIYTEVTSAKSSIDQTATNITAQVTEVSNKTQTTITNANAAALSASGAATSAATASTILTSITNKETSINETASSITLLATQVSTNTSYAAGYASDAASSASNSETYYNQTVAKYTQLVETADGLIITAARTAVSEVVIGGRNILNMSVVGGTSATDNFGGTNAYYKVLTANTVWQIENWNIHTVDTYSLSFYVKSSVALNISTTICKLGTLTSAVTTDWTRVTLENIAVNNDYLNSPYNGLIEITPNTDCTLYIANIKLESGTKCTAYTPSPEDTQSDITTAANTAQSNAKNYSDSTFVTTTTYTAELSVLNDSIDAKATKTEVNALTSRVSTAEAKITSDAINLTVKSQVDTAVSGLQSQIDNVVQDYFDAYDPTLSNTPASDWTTDTLKNNHLGDLFYNTTTGKCFRFALISSVYQWITITDTDITTALANAASAQATANTASTNASDALTQLTNITSDNILSPAEKPSELLKWNQVVAEHTTYVSEAYTYSITTEATSYTNYFNALATYLNGSTTWTSGTPSFFSDLSTNTVIVGSDYRTTWQNYYIARTTLLNKITAQAKAQAISDSKSYTDSNFVTSTTYNSEITVLTNSITSKVSQTDFNALGTRLSTAESSITQNTTDITSKVSTTDYNGNSIVSLINQTSTTISISADHINLTGSSITLATTASVTTAIDNIQIGGTNLFGFNKGITLGGDILSLDSLINGLYFTGTLQNSGKSGWGRIANLGFNGIGGTFTVSGYIKASAVTTSCNLNLCDYQPESGGYVPITTEYTYFSRTYTNVQNYISVGNYNGFLDFEETTTGVVIYVKDLKIERGTKATSWSPAPEDMVTTTTYQSGITALPGTIDARITTQISSGGSIYTAVASSLTLDGNGISLFGKTIDISGATIFNSITQNTKVTVDATGLDVNTYYPITINLNTSELRYSSSTILVRRELDTSYGVPSYATHSLGFSVLCSWQTNGSGWGSLPIKRIINSSVYDFSNVVPIGAIGQMGYSSEEYIYVRGGSKYDVQINKPNVEVTLRTSAYTSFANQTIPLLTSVDFPVDDLSTAKTNLATNLGYSSYSDMVTAAGNNQTIITGGYIRTSLIEATAVITAALVSGTITAGTATITNLTVDSGTFTKATVTGKVTATSGTIGAFSLTTNGLLTASTLNSTITLLADGIYIENTTTPQKVVIETNFLNATSISNSQLMGCAYFSTTQTSFPNMGNTAIMLNATGSNTIDTDTTGYQGNHAIFIQNGYISGFNLHIRRITAGQTLSIYDNVIICKNTSNIAIILPSTAGDGHLYKIKNVGSASVFIGTNGTAVINNGKNNSITQWGGIPDGRIMEFWYDKVNNVWEAGYSQWD